MNHLAIWSTAGAVFTAPVMLADAVVIGEGALIPLSVGVACCIGVAAFTSKMTRVLQRIEDRLDQMDKDMASIKGNCESRHHYAPDDPRRLP